MLLTVSPNRASAVKAAKQTSFFKTNHFQGAASHIDDQYGIDVDDLYEIEDILPVAQKAQFCIRLTPVITDQTDEIHLGYLKLSKLK